MSAGDVLTAARARLRLRRLPRCRKVDEVSVSRSETAAWRESQQAAAWPSLAALGAGIVLVSITTAAYGHATMANWEAAAAVVVPLVGLWIARRRATPRGGSRRRVGYGIVALVAILAAPLALPVAAFNWGYLTFLGAALFVLGVRSRQRVTWVSGAITAVAGVLTGSSVVRGAVGIHESASAAATSAAVQASLGLIVLLLTVRVFMVERDRPPTVSGSIGHK